MKTVTVTTPQYTGVVKAEPVHLFYKATLYKRCGMIWLFDYFNYGGKESHRNDNYMRRGCELFVAQLVIFNVISI